MFCPVFPEMLLQNEHYWNAICDFVQCDDDWYYVATCSKLIYIIFLVHVYIIIIYSSPHHFGWWIGYILGWKNVNDS